MTSLYDGKGAVAMLEMLKQGGFAPQSPLLTNESSSFTPPPLAPATSLPRQSDLTAISAHQRVKENHFISTVEDDHEAGEMPPSSTAEYLKDFDEYIIDKNKENHLISGRAKPQAKKFSLLDRQANATKVAWEGLSQASTAGPSKQKRRRTESETTDESDVPRFQEDPRVPDPLRRAKAAVASHRTPNDKPSPAKRVRTESPVRGPAVAAGQIGGVVRTRQSPVPHRDHSRRAVSIDDPENQNDDSEDDRPPYSQIKLAAAQQAMKARLKNGRPVQRRVAWSEHDEDHLVYLIEKYGCSWSQLQSIGDFEHPRDQVALKDKARNLKVTYLK